MQGSSKTHLNVDTILRLRTSSLVFIGLVFLVGALSIYFQTPLSPFIIYDESTPQKIWLYVIPGLAHLIAIFTMLIFGGMLLMWKYHIHISSLKLYISMSALLLILDGMLIFHPIHKTVVYMSWDIQLFPQDLLKNAVKHEIQLALHKNDMSVCEFLDQSKKDNYVSGATPSGIGFKVSPSKTLTLDAIGGQRPLLCRRDELFDAAKTAADYYDDFDWFAKDCTASSLTEKCDFLQRNLLQYSAPSKPIWHQAGFSNSSKGTGTSSLEFLASPGRGVLFIKTIPVQGDTIRIEDTAKYKKESEKINQYKIMHFNCTERSVAEVSNLWDSTKTPLTNHSTPKKNLKYEKIATNDGDLNSRLTFACSHHVE